MENSVLVFRKFLGDEDDGYVSVRSESYDDSDDLLRHASVDFNLSDGTQSVSLYSGFYRDVDDIDAAFSAASRRIEAVRAACGHALDVLSEHYADMKDAMEAKEEMECELESDYEDDDDLEDDVPF